MLRWVLLVVLASLKILAEDPALIRLTDTWRFLKVTEAEPHTGWNLPDYDDSTWLSGRGSFGSPAAAYGWPDTTRLDSDALAYAFRKKFKVENPDGIKSLILRMDYQHGFIAYLNGTQIARRSLPTNTTSVSFNMFATPHRRGPTEEIDVSAFIPRMESGTNILAIQLHSSGSDLEIALAPELIANFTRGPFIQNTTTNSTQVIWKTVDSTTGFVLYGKTQDDVRTILSPAQNTTHAVTLTNLEPNQSYVYRVFSERGGSVAADDWISFRTLKAPGAPIRFQVFADTGQLTPGQYAIANRMFNTPADLVFHCGDVAYPWYISSQADIRCFGVYRDQMRSVPLFLAMGNHDGYYNLTDFQNDFYLPTNSLTGSELFYSFDHGDVHFVAVATDTQSGQRYDASSPQYGWLENDLANSKQPWKFLFFHHVYRSSSIHSYDDFLVDGVLDKYALQAFIGGLAEKYGVQVIFNGHDHNYERFASFNGVNSFVSGGGGASLYHQQLYEPGSVQYLVRHNFLDVSVDGPNLTVETRDENGLILDRFFRSQTSSQTYTSYWASPTIETTSAADSSGNIPGQRFDFSGPSIDTAAGKWGNLGRIHVRNDSTHLYLGFEQAVLHPNQVIAVFLENPSAPGVSSLAGLGDNQVGGEVDGLDLLDRLAFNNFNPSIACLLGDELADANLRTFQRASMRWAAGQGVFRLDQNFTSIEGVRLQQFNRSPQVPVVFPESNADLIEVAIPRAALGNPTTNILLGAIIFSDPVSGIFEPEIDTAYAGRSFTPGDFSYFLEPLTIELATSPFSELAQFNATRLTNSQIRFTWNSNTGARYWIQQTPDITQTFQDIQSDGFPYTASAATTTLDLTLDETLSPPRFFRLRWE